MGTNLTNNNVIDWGSARCNIGLSGCFPDQIQFTPSTLLRYQQRREGESCYGTSGVCAPGLYCGREYKCCRLPWDPPPSYPYYQLYRPRESGRVGGDVWYKRNTYESFLY